jgi:transcriptional accessory protein Tex/SPT6
MGLDLVKLSDAALDTIVYLGDGGGTCGGEGEAAYLQATLEQVTAANTERVRINCIGVGTASALSEQFLRDLASRNGGTYTLVSP